MEANITMRQLWMNPEVMNFFFRKQAQDTLKELMELVEEDILEVFDIIEDYGATAFASLDDVEELLYNEPIDVIIEELGLTPLDVD